MVVSNCTLLIGEDKWQSLGGAVGDLRAKRKGQHLSCMHYGEVLFLLGYAAAGSRFQWFWLAADGSQVSFLIRCSLISGYFEFCSHTGS
jgi:hypothetical protein